MKVAVVGCGYWGSKHVRVLHSVPDVKLVVGVDRDPRRLSILKRAFPSMKTLPDLGDALELVDAVVIATDPQSHADCALAAIQAGKSVLVEKPLATSSADARLLIDAAKRAGVVLAVGHTFEYNAGVWKLRELIESGELGAIHYVDSARLNLGLYQSNVNVIWDLAPHDVSIINYMLGSQPAVVEAWGSRHAHSDLEDVAYIRLRYRDPDVSATIHVSWLDPCKVRRMTVVGSAKMAVYNDLSSEERVRVYDKGVVPVEPAETLAQIPMSYRYGDIVSPFLSFEEPLLVQDGEFVSCILTGERPHADGENGLAVVRVLEAAQSSLQTGRSIRLLPGGSSRRRSSTRVELAR
jgi:predicted dehydrogenase